MDYLRHPANALAANHSDEVKLVHPAVTEADSKNGSEPARPRPVSKPPRRAGSPTMSRATVIARGRKGKHTMATPISRRPEPGDEPSQAVSVGSAAGEYLLPATRRGLAAQAAATLGILTGLWVALSPFFIVLQQGGSNATIANLIAGLAVAAFGAVAVASRRGFGGLEFGSLVLGVWVIISSFILDAKFTIAAPMFWSNTFAGAVLVLLGLAGLATASRATR